MKSTKVVSQPIASRESSHAHVGHADRLVPNLGRWLEASRGNGSTRPSVSTINDATCQSWCSNVLRNLKPDRSTYGGSVRSRARNTSVHVDCQKASQRRRYFVHGNASQQYSTGLEWRPNEVTNVHEKFAGREHWPKKPVDNLRTGRAKDIGSDAHPKTVCARS